MIRFDIFGEKKIEFEGGSFLAYLHQRLLETEGKQIKKSHSTGISQPKSKHLISKQMRLWKTNPFATSCLDCFLCNVNI